MSASSEVIIVGAGVTGLSTAYLLSQSELKVTLIAPQGNANAASLAAGAMIDAFGEIEMISTKREEERLEFEVLAQRAYSDWLAQIESDSGQEVFSRKGIVVVANNGGEHDLPKMRLMREKMHEFGENFDDLDYSDLKGLLPHPSYRVQDAFLVPEARCVDTRQLLAALEIATFRRPNTQRIFEAVSKIDRVDGTWAVTTEEGQIYTAERVVVCAGAHTRRLIHDEAVQLPSIFFGRGSSAIVTDGPILPHTIRTPNRALSCGIHMVPQANGRLYLGATNLFGVDFDKIPTGPTVGEIHTLFEAIQTELNTSLRNISIESLQSGLRPVSQYNEPLCGETNLPGLFVITGTHRTGVHMSPLLAQVISAEILGRDVDFFNPFDPKREAENRSSINLRLGVRSLIATVLFPTGKLPYNRMEELEVYISELLRLITNSDDASEHRDAFLQVLKDVPLDEQGILQAYHSILERALPSYGPYPS